MKFLDYMIANESTGRDKGVPLDMGKETLSAEEELEVVNALAAAPHLMMATSLLNSAEYEALFGADIIEGRNLIANEPTEVDDLFEYYAAAGKNRAQTEGVSAHLPTSVRAWIALSVLMSRAQEQSDEIVVVREAGARLRGITFGELVGVQRERCRRSSEEATEQATSFLNLISAIGASH